MIKTLIFDMDGVLIDSEEAITLAAQEALSCWGINAKFEDFKQFTGMGENKFLGGVAALYGAEYTLDMKDKTYEIYVSTAKDRVKVYPWSKEILNGLKERGIKIALASAADYTKVECNLQCIGVNPDIFSAIVTGSDVKHKKPHPDIFLTAAKIAGFNPDETLVVEDALSGTKAAKAAGMHCLALTTSFTENLLKEAGADFVFPDLYGIFELIERCNKK